MHDKIVWIPTRQPVSTPTRRSAQRSAAFFVALALISCADEGQGGSLEAGSAAPVTGADSDASAASGGSAAAEAGAASGATDASSGGMTAVDAGTGRGPGGRSDGGGATDTGTATTRDSGGSTGSDAGPAMQSSGCGMEPAAAGMATMQVGGAERQYVVALPQPYDKNRPYPLIVAFHGAGLSGPQFRNFFNLVTPVGADGIVIYPTGTGGQWDVRRDVPFVDALLMKLQSSYCVDARRVFATGHSNGGFFTNAIGCQRGDVFRGIAPMSGGQQQSASSCKGTPAVWISHGDNDTIVATMYGTQTRDFWVKRNMCNANMSTPVMPSPCVEYQGCAAGAPVRYCEYSGDHNLMANSAQTIWAFFKSF